MADPRYCEEDPSVVIKCKTPSLNPDEELSAAVNVVENEATIIIGEVDKLPGDHDAFDKCKTKELDDSENVPVQKILEVDVACVDFSEMYRQQHAIPIEEESFIATTAVLTGTTDVWWTASFICPVAGFRYNSGTLRDLGHEMRNMNSENVFWYRKKSETVRAVASRALDSLRCLELSICEPRHCEEDPSSFLRFGMEAFEEPELRHNVHIRSETQGNSRSPTKRHTIKHITGRQKREKERCRQE